MEKKMETVLTGFKYIPNIYPIIQEFPFSFPISPYKPNITLIVSLAQSLGSGESSKALTLGFLDSGRSRPKARSETKNTCWLLVSLLGGKAGTREPKLLPRARICRDSDYKAHEMDVYIHIHTWS